MDKRDDSRKPMTGEEVDDLLRATLHGPLPQNTVYRMMATLADWNTRLKDMFEAPSRLCEKYHVQACHHCERMDCGDNTSEAKRALREANKAEQERDAALQKAEDYLGDFRDMATRRSNAVDRAEKAERERDEAQVRDVEWKAMMQKAIDRGGELEQRVRELEIAVETERREAGGWCEQFRALKASHAEAARKVAGEIADTVTSGQRDRDLIYDTTQKLILAALDTPADENGGKDTMIKVDGKPFRCECGCNVFRKKNDRYVCNSCRAKYIGEPDTPADEKGEAVPESPMKQVADDFRRLAEIKETLAFTEEVKAYAAGTPVNFVGVKSLRWLVDQFEAVREENRKLRLAALDTPADEKGDSDE